MLLRDVDFGGADLRAVNLRGATLINSRLAGCDLSGADLRHALLVGADFSGCNLTDARLAESLLRGADLSGADLTGAHLLWCDLTTATLTGADISGSVITLDAREGEEAASLLKAVGVPQRVVDWDEDRLVSPESVVWSRLNDGRIARGLLPELVAPKKAKKTREDRAVVGELRVFPRRHQELREAPDGPQQARLSDRARGPFRTGRGRSHRIGGYGWPGRTGCRSKEMRSGRPVECAVTRPRQAVAGGGRVGGWRGGVTWLSAARWVRNADVRPAPY
jgi:hypothetical protein